MKTWINITLLLLTNIYFTSFVFAESISLKSGKVVEGKIIEKTDRYIKIDFEGVFLTYFLDEIEAIDGKKVALSVLKNEAARKELVTVEGRDIKGKSARPISEETYKYYEKGLQFRDEKKYVQAIEEFKKVLEIAPYYYEAVICIGISYTHLSNYPEAKTYLNKALEMNPDDTNALTNMGNVYRRMGDYQRAVSYFKKTIEIDSENGIAYYNLGSVYGELGQNKEARENFLKAKNLFEAKGDFQNSKKIDEDLRKIPN